MLERQCPLCGGENHCVVAKGGEDCWCMTVSFPEYLLNAVQTEPNKCICQTCLDTYKEDQ
ncbi:cysteine-rich CWC family protein [Lysinibacillus cavernae]|uniref:cysteine-rich CWC family protein n=1 Tax=Lysinibacillus cavernae TaxID=2666135 RepID=UPI0012D877A9|nr:cysteine-rich CWC family protein [Lysinibacillus cavernae]